MNLRPIIITLTSIPPRFPFLERRLKKLVAQTYNVAAIELYIPKRYKRFPLHSRYELPALPKGVDLRWVDEDLGPATKILPAYERWMGQDVDLLLCDDDRAHDSNWLKRLSDARTLRPSDIICERGWNVDERFGFMINDEEISKNRARQAPSGGRTVGYRIARALSLGLLHPPRRLYSKSGYVDIFEGFLGALIPPNAFHRHVFEIPESMWMVDDVWLSGMATIAKTKIWVHDTPRPVFSDGKVDRIEALRDFSFDGNNREDSELQCTKYFREKYGIWI